MIPVSTWHTQKGKKGCDSVLGCNSLPKRSSFANSNPSVPPLWGNFFHLLPPKWNTVLCSDITSFWGSASVELTDANTRALSLTALTRTVPSPLWASVSVFGKWDYGGTCPSYILSAHMYWKKNSHLTGRRKQIHVFKLQIHECHENASLYSKRAGNGFYSNLQSWQLGDGFTQGEAVTFPTKLMSP